MVPLLRRVTRTGDGDLTGTSCRVGSSDVPESLLIWTTVRSNHSTYTVLVHLNLILRKNGRNSRSRQRTPEDVLLKRRCGMNVGKKGRS